VAIVPFLAFADSSQGGIKYCWETRATRAEPHLFC